MPKSEKAPVFPPAARLDDEDICKINNIRLLLEAEAMRLARANMNAAEATRLTQALRELDQATSSPAEDRIGLDFEFHRMIWTLSGNEYLERTLSSLVSPVFAEKVIRLSHGAQGKASMLSHKPILDYVFGKSRRQAEEILEEHLSAYW
jgi:GntR family transcriptional repressor for pyruvate dehydrogenase complex